jgi:hypothetical protein
MRVLVLDAIVATIPVVPYDLFKRHINASALDHTIGEAERGEASRVGAKTADSADGLESTIEEGHLNPDNPVQSNGRETDSRCTRAFRFAVGADDRSVVRSGQGGIATNLGVILVDLGDRRITEGASRRSNGNSSETSVDKSRGNLAAAGAQMRGDEIFSTPDNLKIE